MSIKGAFALPYVAVPFLTGIFVTLVTATICATVVICNIYSSPSTEPDELRVDTETAVQFYEKGYVFSLGGGQSSEYFYIRLPETE